MAMVFNFFFFFFFFALFFYFFFLGFFLYRFGFFIFVVFFFFLRNNYRPTGDISENQVYWRVPCISKLYGSSRMRF